MRVRANPLLAFLALPLAASWAPLSASWAPFALRPRAAAPRVGCDAVVCAAAEEYSAVEAADTRCSRRTTRAAEARRR